MNEKTSKILIIGGIVLLVIILVLLYFKPWGHKRSAPKKTDFVQDTISLDKRSDSQGLPEFSVESGFYPESFELTLSGKGTIYYTLDGSDPAGNEAALKYEKPISIYDNTPDKNKLSAIADITLGYYNAPSYTVDKGIIVRAVSCDDAGNYGKTVTKSYFVNKTDSYYQNMKVISLVTNPYNLFDGKDGIYVVGDRYYEWQKSSKYDPDIEDWSLSNPTNYNKDGKGTERPATVQIFENGKLAYEQDLGIRVAGNVSRSNAQKSIRLYAREEYGDKKLRYAFFPDLKDVNGELIEKFDKVTLRNDGNDTTSAYFRDELIQTLCQGLNVDTQAEEPCIMFIDGEFWGMYHIKERLEDYYFASHYDEDKKNITIMKCSKVEGSEEIGDEYEMFYNWAIEQDLSIQENYEKVAAAIDIPSMIDYFAIETYINNYDWLNVGRSANNFMMWRVNEPTPGKPGCDGKWRFALYDMEYSSGLYGQEGTMANYDAFGNINKKRSWTNIGLLFFHLLENENFNNAFYDRYIEIMDNNFAPAHVLETIDACKAKYGDGINANYARFMSLDKNTGTLDYHISIIESYFNKRPSFALKYLDKVCGK